MKLDNEFSVRSIDLDSFDFPKVTVGVWSRLFGSGGSVCVEAKTPEGVRLTLHNQDIEEDRSVVDEREYAQSLADEWNEICRENWLTEIERCWTYVVSYQQKKVDSFDKEVAELKAYREKLGKCKKVSSEASE